MKTKKFYGKRVLSLALTLLMVLSLFPLSALQSFAAELETTVATTIFSTSNSSDLDYGNYSSSLYDKDGDGYYEINSVADLYGFSYLVNEQGYYDINAELTANIAVNGYGLDPNSPYNRKWIPIGYNDDRNNYYRGNFNGNGKYIYTLYTDGEFDYAGLFGNVAGTISNVSIINSYFFGKKNAGSIAAYKLGGVVKNCYSNSTVKVNYSEGYYAGGIVGSNANIIMNCFFCGSLSGIDVSPIRVNGVGEEHGCLINNFYPSDMSLPAGEHHGTKAEISQLKSGEIAYLLQGDQEEQIWGQRIDSEPLPSIGGKKVYYGYKHGSNEKIYSNEELSEEISPHNYKNGICTICGAYEPAVDSDNDTYYEIDNAGKLYWFAEQVNSGKTDINAILKDNITVNDGVVDENTTDAKAWIPIGTEENKYNGTFNGNNKTISGLYINDTSKDSVGLFGLVYENGTIKNVTIDNSYINGNAWVGGIAGTNDGTVENCCNKSKVSGLAVVGGIVGNHQGTLTNCNNSGTVTGNEFVGGIVGINYDMVENCSNTGTINGNTAVGGIEGSNYTAGFHDAIVKNCSNAGTINAEMGVGGIVGVSCGDIDTSTTIFGCYNTGEINGKVGVGGILGFYESGYNYISKVYDCYNTGIVRGEQYTGGIVGQYSGYEKEDTLIYNCYNTGTVICDEYFGGVAGYIENAKITNCYYVDTACSGGINGEDIAGQAEAKTAEQFASGEVAYLLGDAFGQKIGTDLYPVLGGDKVYCIVKDAYTKEKIYSNTPLECDVDLDGLLTIKDATMISKYLVGREDLNDVQLSLADANNDGTININDVTQIQKILVRA